VTLRVAAVGTGWVTLNRHVPWLRRTPGVEVIGLIDRNPDRAEAARARLRLPRVAAATGPEGVPWLDQADAVSIGTPPQTHHALAAAYLHAGKHVLLEKPMAMTPSEGRDLVRLAERADRVLAVVQNFQFARSVRKLRALVEDGSLGEVRSIRATQLSNPARRLPEWYEELPLGLFYDESPHFFYLLRALAGAEPRLAASEIVPSAGGRRTPASVTLRFDCEGLPVHVAMDFEATVSEWQVAVLGSRLLAVVDVFRDVLVVLPNDGPHRAREILGTTYAAVTSHLWGVATSGALHLLGRLAYGNDEVMRRFAAACVEGTPPEGISARDGLKTLELQHAVLAAVGPS